MVGDSLATFAARLQSFEAVVKVGRKNITWRRAKPTPAELSEAGFYFKPSASSHDNAQCFLCESALDNWEEDDSPLAEHLKHAPQCGWAILKELGQETFDPTTMEDPTQTRLSEARLATFMEAWPHESKRGWHCKTAAMVAAGWHFAPTPESDDFVSCAYCKLSLDGWEPKDNPFEEHYRRSPDCPFFFFAGTTAPKATRGKKNRSSKASRLSTQSTATSASEVPSIPDLDESIDVSTLSVNTVASSVSALSHKKGSKSKARSVRASKVEQIESIGVEPPLVQEGSKKANTKASRGEKRKSDQISDDGRAERESTVRPEPPPKRRNTRTRSSIIEQVDYPALGGEPEPMAVGFAQPKPTKGGKKRASSRTRKISAASTASLRAAIPDNATIDAELAADLDRAMSGEDQPAVVENPPKKRGRKPKTTASTASTRGHRPTSETQDVLGSDAKVHPAEDSGLELTYSTDLEGPAPPRSKSTTKRVSKKNAAKRTTRTNPGSAGSIDSVATGFGPDFDSSIITSRTEADDSGHETDASVGGKSIARKSSKRKATTKGRGKRSGTGIMSKNIEDIVQFQPQNEALPLPGAAAQTGSESAAVQEDMEEVHMQKQVASAAANVEALTESEKASKKPKRPAPKAGKAKKPRADDRPPQLSMPGAFSPLMPDQEQNVEPSFASVLSPTPPPVVAGYMNNINAVPSPHTASQDTQAIPPQLPPRSPLRNTTTSARPELTSQCTNTPRGQKETTPSPSPQSSDAENAPPSTRPPSTRPPLAPLSPLKNQITRIPLAPGTPRAVPLSPSKIGGGLRSDVPWTRVDVEMVFASSTPGIEKENVDIFSAIGGKRDGLTSPEKKMTVEEWISWQAQKAEEVLRAESERVVGIFEREGGRALRVLEGIEVSD